MGQSSRGTPPPTEPTVLLEEIRPGGLLETVVLSDGRTIYMYLAGLEGSNFETRSVWVRNLVDGPRTLNTRDMESGVPPVNPAPFVRPDAPQTPLDLESLSVVWLPEGNGAALKEGNQLLAIIPPWSGTDGFFGYAAAAAGEGPLAWGLEADNVLHERFERAEGYWASWESPSRWADTQSATMSAYEQAFGPHSGYFAIDGDEWPPKALVRIDASEGIILATVGLGVRPMPNVEMSVEDYRDCSRIELGVVVPKAWDNTAVMQLAAFLSGVSDYPWSHQTWLGDGHTLPCDAWQCEAFAFALLSVDHPWAPKTDLPTQDDDPVVVLWLIPISEEEQQLAEDSGSAALLERLPADRWRTS